MHVAFTLPVLCTESKSDLDGQLKILEEKNTTLIQTNLELEEVTHNILGTKTYDLLV